MNSKKTKIAGLLLLLVTVLTAFQGFIPTIPNLGQHTTTLISAVAMYLVTGLTIWRQFLSKQIDSAAVWPTAIVAIVATIGGLNDLLNVITFSELTEQWVRFGITFTTFTLNILSKLLWPTPETKGLI